MHTDADQMASLLSWSIDEATCMFIETHPNRGYLWFKNLLLKSSEKKTFVLGSQVQIVVMTSKMIVVTSAKGQFARGDCKKRRSHQYHIVKPIAAPISPMRVHAFRRHMPHSSEIPATSPPPPLTAM
ncbi:MAG: hypothetical protein Fur0043_10240 [Anaerolineales bacterium]